LLTERGSNNNAARLSTDDRHIAYIRVVEDESEVRVMDRETGEVKVIHRARDDLRPAQLCWSPDGRRLAVKLSQWHRDAAGRRIYDERTSRPRVFVFDLDGRQSEPLPIPADLWNLTILDWR
jgi:Tol biopolymer transport system component